MFAAQSNKSSGIGKDFAAATGNIKGFFADKIDDASYYMEKKQRQFDISGAGNGFDRKKGDAVNWFNKETQGLVNLEEGFGTTTTTTTREEDGDSGSYGCNFCGMFSAR